MSGTRRGARLSGLVVAVAALSLAFGGCGFTKQQPTPIVIVVNA